MRLAADQALLQLKSVLKKAPFNVARRTNESERTELEEEEIVLCAGDGQVLFTWQCKSLQRRVALLQQLQQLSSFLFQNTPADQALRPSGELLVAFIVPELPDAIQELLSDFLSDPAYPGSKTTR